MKIFIQQNLKDISFLTLFSTCYL